MPQHLPDLGQRRPGAQHLGGQRVPQLMRTPPLQPGTLARPGHDRADAVAGSCRYGLRTVTNTARASHRGRPRVSHAATASPAGAGNGSRSVRLPLPVTVISPARQSMSSSCQPGGLASAQPQPGQQRQDRVVTQASRGLPVAAVQQPLDLRGLQARAAARPAATTRPPAPPPPAGQSVLPVACANRKNARSDVTIAFADQMLRSRA